MQIIQIKRIDKTIKKNKKKIYYIQIIYFNNNICNMFYKTH
jgi:hypothetical protein